MRTSKLLRVMALFLALVLVVSLTGCTAGTTTSEYWEEEVITVSGTENNTQEEISSVKSDTTSGPTQTTKPGQFDLKGKSVILAGWTNGFEPQKTSSTYKEEMKRIAEIEKKYNCKITFKNSSESLLLFGEWSTATMAGQRFSDITYMASNQYYPQSALRGFLSQLDGRIDFNNNCWVYDVFRATELKGKHYFALPANNAISLAGGGLMFNKEIFAKFGLKNPYDYVAQGNWNWETFRQLAIDCTRVDNGVQYYGLGGPITSSLIRANGGGSSYYKDGKEVFGLDTPHALEAMEFSRKLYNDDKVCPTTSDAKFENGQIAMTGMSWYGLKTYADEMGDKIGYTYFPIGPNTKDYNYTGYECNLVGVTNLAIDADACAAIMQDWFQTAPWMPTLEERCEVYCPDETSLKVMVDCTQRAMASIEMIGFFDWYWRNVWWSDMGIKSNTSPRTYVDSIKDASQASIDEVWDLYDSFE